MPDFTWLSANQASTEDVEALFATGGAASPTLRRRVVRRAITRA